MHTRVSASPRPRWPGYVGMLLFALVLLYPVLRIAAVALEPGNQSLVNFRSVINEPAFVRWVSNSALIALAISVVGTAIAAMAGYALSRSDVRGCSPIQDSRCGPQLLAGMMLLLPLYLILMKLGLLSASLGLLIIYMATVLPFCICHLKSCYDSISPSLEEAASIDGCSRSQSFRLVVLPLVWPALITTAVLSFLSSGALYLLAAIVLQDGQLFTAPAGLVRLQATAPAQPGLYAAGALLVSIPMIALFLIVRRTSVSRRWDHE